MKLCKVMNDLDGEGRLTPRERGRYEDLILEYISRRDQIDAAWERGTRSAGGFEGAAEPLTRLKEALKNLEDRLSGLYLNG